MAYHRFQMVRLRSEILSNLAALAALTGNYAQQRSLATDSML